MKNKKTNIIISFMVVITIMFLGFVLPFLFSAKSTILVVLGLVNSVLYVLMMYKSWKKLTKKSEIVDIDNNKDNKKI